MSFTFKTPNHGKRRFYDLPSITENPTRQKYEEKENLLDFISNDVIGGEAIFSGPFGQRRIVYCDYIASGRALHSIEDYIRDKILPMYGNTHTTTTVTSLQSSMFYQEARMCIRNAVKANEHDAVIFTGNGVTGAVHKLISALNFQSPPVVFVGPFEHHSNLLPWRNIAAQVVQITEDENGNISLLHLEEALRYWSKCGLELIGCFSGASNINGIITDTNAVSMLMHRFGGLVFWDFATAGPYLEVDMHPHTESASKDALFLSMHKFIGGVDAPGILVAKKSLFRSRTPSGGGGGGSVFFVTKSSHRYLRDEEEREEGGSPRVGGAVRAALAMELKMSVGTYTIMQNEEEFYQKAIKAWKSIPNLHLLGNTNHNSSHQHLAVFSFMIFFPQKQCYLHHNYVAALLNDLFGIQARGGCACAGPYAQDLLGISEELATEFEEALIEDSRLDRVHLRRQGEYSQNEAIRPGFVRLNLPYFFDGHTVGFVIRAVAMVAEMGWKLLPQYMFNPETGGWRHTKHKIFVDRCWIGNSRFTSKGLISTNETGHKLPAKTYSEVLEFAQDMFNNPLKGVEPTFPDHSLMFSKKVQHLCWFLLPSQAHNFLLNKTTFNIEPCAIKVRRKIKPLSKDEILESLQKTKTFNDKLITPNNLQRLQSFIANMSIETENTIAENVTENSTISPRKKDNNCSQNVCFLKRRSPIIEKNGKNKLHEGVKFISPPKNLFKLTCQAIEDFRMLENNDRVLVCLSGGKDSLSLLHILHQYQFYAESNGIKFDLGALTIDPMTSSYDPSPLIPYLEELKVPYFYEEQDIMEQAKKASATSICAFCSRMKRGRIYATARRERWNVLAFGQHLDDLAESFFMSVFHNGLLRTMKANYVVNEGDIRVIRPLVYARETDTRHFAESAKLPIIPENCPACFEAPKERQRMKQLLAAQEILYPKLFYSIKEAILPLMAKNKTGLESSLKKQQLFND